MEKKSKGVKKVKWFVTVYGTGAYYTPNFEFASKTIELPEGKTPVDWFLSRPTVYSRFDFVPSALLMFQKLE